MTNRPRLQRRPATWMRLAAGLVFILLAGDSLDLRDPVDLIVNSVMGALLLTAVVAPRSLYDGRADRWLRAHRVIRAGLMVVGGAAWVLILLSALEVI
ncbi:hypothetical protein ACQPXM_30820 [Kribbella sp. CA-253562]|uniref:hypothetical protein n=1 Tax=Kribbella sp. CA-253562 TaxID=3239942 RepID=UPI003D9280CE